MKFNKEIKVEVATLHQSVQIPGVGATDKTISEAKFKGIEMYYIPQGLHMAWKGVEYIIPHAALGACKLFKEADPEPVVAVKGKAAK